MSVSMGNQDLVNEANSSGNKYCYNELSYGLVDETQPLARGQFFKKFLSEVGSTINSPAGPGAMADCSHSPSRLCDVIWHSLFMYLAVEAVYQMVMEWVWMDCVEGCPSNSL